MSLTLHIDEARWRANLARVAERGALVPVAKGNGYGLGLARLATEANRLGADTLAIGTYDEYDAVAGFTGNIVVLNPWRPFSHREDDRIIHTVGRLSDLEQVRGRVLLEAMTSMKRHGFTAAELRSAAQLATDRGLRVEGLSIHLPLGGGLAEVERLIDDGLAAGLAGPIWASHLSAEELAQVRQRHPGLSFRPRIGTELWLGDRGALSVSATVIDIHPIKRGESFGYRGRAANRSGHLVIASGGTAHGLGLVAPSTNAGLRDRASAMAKGSLEASGVLRSPYSWQGRQLRFAEPPHMQSSMLIVPSDLAPPTVGDQLVVQVRFTTTTFDRVEFV